MPVYPITTTEEQETALTLMASAGKTTNQQILVGLVNDALLAFVNQRKESDLAALEEQSLDTLEALTTQNPIPASKGIA